MAPLPLRELQSRLRALISDPRTLTASDSDLEPALTDLVILGDARLSAAERVRIYGRMYFLRLGDALAQDFPALQHALGSRAFDAAARAYVTAYPSDRPSLRELGRHLPGWAHGRPGLVAPWQAELAQLEWAMVEAFDAMDQPVLAEAQLERRPAAAWPSLRLAPVGSLVLLSCTFAVDVLRERLLAKEAAEEPVPEPVLLRVWRQEHQVYVRRTGAREMAALRWLHTGAAFADLCAWLAEHNPDDPASEATALLRRWLEDGLLVAS
jgi:hypothetical protein